MEKPITLELDMTARSPAIPQDDREEIKAKLAAFDKYLKAEAVPNLDRLMICTGVFCVILAPFLAVTFRYIILQQRQDPIAKILLQVSGKLDGSPVDSESIVSIPDPSPYAVSANSSPAILTVNAFWCISLILSILTASSCLSMKQLIQDHLSLPPADRPTSIRTRTMSYNNLARRRTRWILSLLPVLMQIAVLLFVAGMAIWLLAAWGYY